MKRGQFIVFEGIDGCGKTSQLKFFSEFLFSHDKHNHVLTTREPYKTLEIRKLVKDDPDPLSGAEKMTQIFLDDRKQHVEELITPALDKGWHVVSDRYKLSTIAYQSAQGLPMEHLIQIQSDLPVPDMTFIIDLPANIAAQRMALEKEREAVHKFESNLDFLERVRLQFKRLKDILADEKIFVIDGSRSKEEIHAEIVSIYKRLTEKPAESSSKARYMSMDDVPAPIKEELKKYFTDVGGDTFVITGLPAELTGGALARYSRASTGMQLTIVNEFLDDKGKPNQEKGSELMDRVLNAYGDDSVGELEGAHVGVENISQLAIKSIEDRRIGGSPIEQSTRYVKYDQKDKDGKWRYIRPKEIMSSPFASQFESVNDLAFEVYQEGINRLVEYFRIQFPESEFAIDVERNGSKVNLKKHQLTAEEEKAFRTAYNFTIRCAALDVGRCVLPSSTLTHVGLFGNGRFFTNVITHMKSSELEEEHERAKDIERELNKVIPTFIKRNREVPHIKEKNAHLRRVAYDLFPSIQPVAQWVDLLDNHENYLDTLLASALYPYSNLSLRQILYEIQKMPEWKKIELFNSYVGKRETRRDRTGRGLEAGYPLTFDLVGCYAEYRDLQRHRMLTQQRQLLSVDLGFVMPPEMVTIGLEKEVEEVVRRMEELNHNLRNAGLLIPSQYATLFNHRLRFMLGMNLREFQHLSELRTQPAGHFSYRSMTMEMARAVKQKYPWAESAFKFVDYSDPGNKITRAKEQSRIAGKNLSTGVKGDVDF